MCSLCASGILGSWLLEYIYVLLSLGLFMFNMPDITTSILSPDPGPSAGGYVNVGSKTYIPSYALEEISTQNGPFNPH